jgi:hypothetical protein
MKNSESLEDFIKTYIENKIVENRKESYESWVGKNGLNSKGIYEGRLADAKTDYMKSRAEYGSVGEALAKRGLSSSGYSDYVSSRAYSDYQKAKDHAFSEYADNERKNRQGYSEYSMATDAKNDSLTKDYVDYLVKLEKPKDSSAYINTITNIGKQSITDYETAYKIALESGLSEELASSVAEIGTSIVKNGIKTKVMDSVVKFSMSEEEARQYALSLGLDTDTAEEIAEYAKNINNGFFSGGFR